MCIELRKALYRAIRECNRAQHAVGVARYILSSRTADAHSQESAREQLAIAAERLTELSAALVDASRHAYAGHVGMGQDDA